MSEILLRKEIKVIGTEKAITIITDNGMRTLIYPSMWRVIVKENKIEIKMEEKTEQGKELLWKWIEKIGTGLKEGHWEYVELKGPGYKGRIERENGEDKLVLKVGKSHLVKINIPKEINIYMETGTKIRIGGTDKEEVGRIALEIRGKIKK